MESKTQYLIQFNDSPVRGVGFGHRGVGFWTGGVGFSQGGVGFSQRGVGFQEPAFLLASGMTETERNQRNCHGSLDFLQILC